MARPTKYTPATVKRIVAAITLGVPYVHAAAIGGIHYDTFREWMAHNPAFSLAIQKAEAACVEQQLDLIQREAHDRNWTAAAWILERRYPDDFGRRERQQVEHSGSIRTELAFINDWRAPAVETVETMETTQQISATDKELAE